MKKISILLAFVALLFSGCKNEPKIDYQYQLEDDLFECDAVDMNLIKEAVYAFEDYIKNHYTYTNPKSVDQGYYYYWEIALNGRIPAVEFISPHILEIRDQLKKIDGLWVTNGETTTLNYNHPLIKCISDHLKDPQMKQTFDVLIQSHTFKENVFLASIKRISESLGNDAALDTYLALDTFYARILNLDFSDMDKLMKINRNKYMEKQKRLFEANKGNLENGKPIKIDSIKTKN
jgi:hypothetical protein